MAAWSKVQEEAGATAQLAQGRIEAHGLALLATLRADGSPRISGLEPLFSSGELWFGMMEGSRKVADLRRDPRFSLHNATIDKGVVDGDVKISGRVVEVFNEETKQRLAEAFAEASGHPPQASPWHLFRAEVGEIATIRPHVDHLIIESWREGGSVTRLERY